MMHNQRAEAACETQKRKSRATSEMDDGAVQYYPETEWLRPRPRYAR